MEIAKVISPVSMTPTSNSRSEKPASFAGEAPTVSWSTGADGVFEWSRRRDIADLLGSDVGLDDVER